MQEKTKDQLLAVAKDFDEKAWVDSSVWVDRILL